MRDIPKSTELRRSFRFFLDHAGYATPPGRAQCALDLARADVWFRLSPEAEELQFITEEDTERAYCYCGDPKCKYREGSDQDWETIAARIVRVCPDHGSDCKHAETVASLGGIMDPDADYLRVIRAELLLEIPEFLNTLKRA